jgi:hypothetical protein
LCGDERVGGDIFTAEESTRDRNILLFARGLGRERGVKNAYGSLENCVLDVFHTFTVSISLATMSSRCVVRAAPSTAGPVPGRPTRSVMSKMIDVKPSLSR